MAFLDRISKFYDWMLTKGDPRVQNWPLMATPGPILTIVLFYLIAIRQGPKIMDGQKVMGLKMFKLCYNVGLVLLSAYMFYEFLVTSILAGYSYICQPVDYSTDPLALRMANVCWWYFFSKIIELVDTLFLILQKRSVSFLHSYHHSTMIVNWWLGVKYIAGGQSWFLAMLNTFVHVIMYSYYGLSALGPSVQKYLWWKKYLTMLQLSQFFAVVIHTGVNMTQTDCDFPQGFNYAVFLYAISLIVLFANFFQKSYCNNKEKSR
ncbi:elongation of very long chain fatty acids protein 4-like [Ruditapes philippinarum]|uniref:elongation of very long chain fatty acids protein 4-like n=1 Tax=Ruditapes philippinarum TaxID=129788 RepID=UPI00295B1567|nr:elongation of very long chain fatty acids protein 4-like [Ruditapes philippinarum]XP_060593392.1 elongation of very long chain fatty acids protein 4-like [Ruditapes philippinarum]